MYINFMIFWKFKRGDMLIKVLFWRGYNYGFSENGFSENGLFQIWDLSIPSERVPSKLW